MKYKDPEKLLMTMLDDFRADQSNIELQRDYLKKSSVIESD
jgi:hypothetical protein